MVGLACLGYINLYLIFNQKGGIMKLSISIDTEDINMDEGWDFESIIRRELSTEITKDVISKVSKDAIETTTAEIVSSINSNVEKKLSSLINEDVAISDGWGKPMFVGSVEDYIKKQIDEKLMAPVDSYGKVVKGCSSSDQTWITWFVKYQLDGAIAKLKDVVSQQANRFLNETLKSEMETFKTKTLKSAIVDHLENLGIK